MNNHKTQPTFQIKLNNTGHRVGIILPITIALSCVTLQMLFTSYFIYASSLNLSLAILLLLSVIIVELFNIVTSKTAKIAEYLVLGLAGVDALAFIVPLPSPYMLFIMLFAMLIYFDFGIRYMIASLGIFFIILSIRYEQMYSFHNSTQTSIFFVFYILICVMTFYSVAFLRISQQELKAIESSTAKALTREKQLESLINNLSDAVIAVDKNYKVTNFNAAALDILDLNTDIKKKPLHKIIQTVNAQNQPISLEHLLTDLKQSVINRDLRIKYADGSYANLFLALAPIYLGYGKSINNGYTLVLRDITREKSLEEERDEFISVVSHELRTPIAIAEGNISNAEFITQKTSDISTIVKSLKEAHKQVLFLADMINDLSTLSRAERGVLEIDVEPIDVPTLMADLATHYSQEAAAKGLEFKIDIDPNLKSLTSSKIYSREILQNFVTNAIKYTEKGSIMVSARSVPEGVRFVVQDTGIGISKNDQEKVFDKFFRSEDYRTRKNNGTGLGLYVTVKLTRLIHATITIDSELNRGSSFTITMPNL